MELLPEIGDSDFMKNLPNDTNWYLYADASCFESGSIGRREELLESMEAAKAAFEEGFAEMHLKVEVEISKIKSNPENYTFDSGYTAIASLIQIPGGIQTVKGARQWVSKQLSDDERLDDRIQIFEGFSVSAHKKTKLSLDDLWERFL